MLNYDHKATLSESRKALETMIEEGKLPTAFGSGTVRFRKLDDAIPGVGSYLIQPNSVVVLNSPSISKKGYGYTMVSKAPKLEPFKDRGIPGPTTYDIKRFNEIDNNNRPSTSFIPSGNGRMPFLPPKPIPGPAAYRINHEPGISPFIKNKKLSTFESKIKRNSMYDIVSPAPPVGKYKLDITLLSPKKDVQWSRSNYIRARHIGYDNQVPPPTHYFQDEYDQNISRSLSPTNSQKSLRTVGNYSGPWLGKLHTRPKTTGNLIY